MFADASTTMVLPGEPLILNPKRLEQTLNMLSVTRIIGGSFSHSHQGFLLVELPPSRAKAKAVARPKPLRAPVMRMT